MKRTRLALSALTLCACLLLGACGNGAQTATENVSTGLLNAEAVSTVSLQSAASTYADVEQDVWYADAVRFVTERGLMVGTGNNEFSPDSTFTRAQLATVLYRIAGEPPVTGEDSFTDTESGAWYAGAVLWSEQNGVVNGVGNHQYGPGNPVTQEQLVTMLWRLEDEPEAAAASDAAAYAAQAVGWARETGIAPATADFTFVPKDNATRAQIAVLMQNYLTRGASSDSGTPVVYFTPDITPEGLVAVYEALGWEPTGKVAVKLSTGESEKSNNLDPALIKDLVELVDGTIVECNTAYGGNRASTAMHYQVAEDRGYTAIAPFQILDENGSMTLPVEGGTRMSENYVGAAFADYDSYLILSLFKGHAMAGFGGAIKNISIGLGSSEGKVWIHSGGTRRSGSIFGDQTAFTECMAEAGKAVADYLGENIVYVSVMNRISIDCDCDGNPAEPDIHDIGILASTDPVALDQACIDLVWNADGSASLVNRINNRNGLHTLEHAEEIGLGSRAYALVDINA